jgi:hypothetical protein
MTPLEGHPGHHAYTFSIRILSTSLTSIFSVCCCSRYLLYGATCLENGSTTETCKEQIVQILSINPDPSSCVYHTFLPSMCFKLTYTTELQYYRNL